jgi:hypothetical protein
MGHIFPFPYLTGPVFVILSLVRGAGRQGQRYWLNRGHSLPGTNPQGDIYARQVQEECGRYVIFSSNML